MGSHNIGQQYRNDNFVWIIPYSLVSIILKTKIRYPTNFAIMLKLKTNQQNLNMAIVMYNTKLNTNRILIIFFYFHIPVLLFICFYNNSARILQTAH